MAERNVTLTAVKEKTQQCACGCAPCEQESCHLICPTRPHFFCGQLLTDQDLAALVTWTQDRLRLQRFQVGWGVVCGLEVTRSDEPGHLVVSPGYAVSCCGDDLVLCQPYTVDLSQVCLPKSRPCEEPSKAEPDDYFFDLMLQAKEEPTAFQTVLGCNGRHSQPDCEHSRVVENTDVVPLPSTREKEHDPIETWFKEYKAWWQRWLEANEPERWGAAWWYRLLEAFWHSPNRDGCHACHQEQGVPLARICVRRLDKRCEVIAIDAYPPARRLLSQDGWPAPRGWSNYAQFLGRSWEEVASEVYTYLHHHTITFKVLEDPERVMELLQQRPMADYGSSLTAVLVEMGKLGYRLVGFISQSRERAAPAIVREQEHHDLTKLYGIGPSSARDLHNAGIYTYEQLLELSREEFQDIVKRRVAEGDYERMLAEIYELIEEAANRD